MGNDSVFDRAVAVVLAHEGGLVDDPEDAGGLTNFGFALTENPDLTAETIRAMTRDQAVARYREKWWLPNRWKELAPEVAIKVFDLAVDIGPSSANKALQRAVRSASGFLLTDDGMLGDITIGRANACADSILLPALKSELAGHYRELVALRPAKIRFLSGWLIRAYS